MLSYLLAALLLAPQQSPVVATPTQTTTAVDLPLNPALPTLFVCGDSTARNQANLGWGDHLAPFLDLSRINLANRAKAGRSARTYINEGLWSHTLAEIKPGDYVLFQFGHNDGGDLAGAKPRGDLKGIGEESQQVPQTTGPLAGTIGIVHTFGWYLRKMIDEAKAKGAHPILLDTTIRNIWKPGPDGNNHIERDMGYNTFIHQVADQEHIPYADMGAIEATKLEALGQTQAAPLFPVDHTHTSPAGATLVAQSVIESLRQIHSPIAAYFKPSSSQ